MKTSTQNSATDSDAMSRNDRDQKKFRETEFLAREVADAKAALVDTVVEIKSSAIESMDLRAWARQYPWAALGVAAVTGFAAATMLSKKPPAADNQPDSSPAPNPAASPPPPQAAGIYPTSATSGLKAMIIGALFGLAKLVIENLLVAAIRGPSPPNKPDNKPR